MQIRLTKYLAGALLMLVTVAAMAGGLDFLGAAPTVQPLSPDEAFHLTLKQTDATHAQANFDVAKGYYLYRTKISFHLQSPDPLKLAEVTLPPGETKTDPFFGAQQVFYTPFVATLRFTAPVTGATVIEASYQGCSKLGICYPPVVQRVTLAGQPPAAAAAPAAIDAQPAADDGTQLFKGGLAAILPGFFGFGLLLAFTPCMFPMIPVLSGIIVGQKATAGRGRATALAVAYVLGMALTWTIAGVLAGLSGHLVQAALQNVWVLSAFSLVFVLLALAMFDVYTLQLPAALQARLSTSANRLPGGRFAGVFAMGAVSALIIGPCVAAPLAAALLYISQTHDVVAGGAALFSMSIGMGVPLVLMAAVGGSLLPRAGAWMNGIKSFFGFLLLASALWIAAPVLPAAALMLGVAFWFIFAGYAVGPKGEPPRTIGRAARSGLAVCLILLGVTELVGLAAGHRTVLAPLAGMQASGAKAAEPLAFQPVSSPAELDAQLKAAGGKPVMLDFYADWCVSCKELDARTFSDPAVQDKLRQFVLLRADVTANTANDAALLKRFGLFGPPGVILFHRGSEPADAPIVGFLPPDAFLARLNALTRS